MQMVERDSRSERGGPGAPAGGPGRRHQIAFLVVLLVYGLSVVAQIGGLNEYATVFPLIVLSGLAVLWAVKLTATLAPPRLASLLEPRGILPRAPRVADTAEAGSAPSPWAIWLWVGSTLAAMVLFGFLVGTALAIAAYLRLIAGESWRVAGIAAAATVVFVYLVFVRAMRIELGGVLSLSF